MANDMYPPTESERDGWTQETALYASSDYDEGDEGDLEYNDFPLRDIKPDITAIQQTRTAWKVFRPKGTAAARAYLQPDVEIVPDIRQTDIGKKAIEHIQHLVSARTSCIEITRDRTKLLKRLNDPEACWGLVKEVTPGQDGGCHLCVKKGYECIVRLESVKDASATGGYSRRVIGRLNPIRKEASGQRSTGIARISLRLAAIDNQRPVARASGSSGPGRARAPPNSGSTILQSRGKPGRKRKIPTPNSPYDLPSTSSRNKRSRNEDLQLAIAASPQATGSTPASAAVDLSDAASVDSAEARNVGSSIGDRELSLEAIGQVRDQAKSVELEIVGRSPGGLDGKTSSLFTMMARLLDIIERAMTPNPPAPPVGRVEALKAINFLPKFAAEARKLIVGDTEDSLDFLFENMFDLMEIHTETLREVRIPASAGYAVADAQAANQL